MIEKKAPTTSSCIPRSNISCTLEFHRQFSCAFESAAFHNPDKHVFVLLDVNSVMERFHGCIKTKINEFITL